MTRERGRSSGVRRWFAVLVGTWGCAAGCAPAAVGAGPVGATSAAPGCDRERDRAAIRGMAGEFEVTFSFDETEILTAGYARHEPYGSEASEVVEITEDSDRAIVLQHVLLVDGDDDKPAAMKHWRQDWTFQDRELVEFRGHETWERRSAAAAEVACAWTQAVYEVTDAPRYASFGHWQHHGDESTWVSHETWRPLPRREYTTRSDYDVLVGVNRHVVRRDGWVHEQNNVKLVLAGDRHLVRERGENRYVRSKLANADLARDYLRHSAPVWTAVRSWWRNLLAAPRVTITPSVAGKPLYEPLFALATRRPLPSAPEIEQTVAEVMRPYARAAPATATSHASR